MGTTDKRATTSARDEDDGGPAFPVPMVSDGNAIGDVNECGMTLRDYFAAQIVGAIIVSAERDGIELKDTDAEADTAYAWAAAMLRARRR